MAKKAGKKKAVKRKPASRKKVTKKTVKSSRKEAPAKRPSKWHAVPLKGSFMATAILGFFISYYYVYPVSYNFGIAVMLIFALMFIASIVSMTKAPLPR